MATNGDAERSDMDEISMAGPSTGSFLGCSVFLSHIFPYPIRTPGYQKITHNEQLLT